ncbi:hypothetical protein NUSPORA_01167 [Nucleospora cyclopteri]
MIFINLYLITVFILIKNTSEHSISKIKKLPVDSNKKDNQFKQVLCSKKPSKSLDIQIHPSIAQLYKEAGFDYDVIQGAYDLYCFSQSKKRNNKSPFTKSISKKRKNELSNQAPYSLEFKLKAINSQVNPKTN